MSVYSLYEEGKRLKLKDNDRVPYGNPQNLTMKELEERIYSIKIANEKKEWDWD